MMVTWADNTYCCLKVPYYANFQVRILTLGLYEKMFACFNVQKTHCCHTAVWRLCSSFNNKGPFISGQSNNQLIISARKSTLRSWSDSQWHILIPQYCPFLLSGASEPVAKAYAEELARHGISIIFVTKDHASVRDTAASLSQSYGVETVIILADFSLDQAASKLIKEALRGKDIGFLVNCVDEALSSPQSLIEMPEQSLLELVNKNVAVATLMTRLVLPGMVERSRGAVVNISSGACCRPLPGRVTLTAATVRRNTQCICLLPSIHTKILTLHCLMSHTLNNPVCLSSLDISGLPGSFLQSSSHGIQRQRDLCPKSDSFPGRFPDVTVIDPFLLCRPKYVKQWKLP